MKIFCPHCGIANESGAGDTATCSACATRFEVPPALRERPVQVEAPRAESGYISPAAWGSTAPVATVGTPTPLHSEAVGYNPMAIASLISGLLVCIPLAGPAAIGLGIWAQQQIKQTGEQGRGMATAGIVLGAVSLLLQLGVLAFVLFLGFVSQN